MFNLLGTDPEVLLINSQGQFKPAIGLIGGTKYNPLSVPCGAIQEDNVMGEFNVSPAETPKQLFRYIKTVMGEIEKRAAKHGLTISKAASGHYLKEDLLHPQAMEAGCEPDFNAWTKKQNPRPPVSAGTLRCAGGHIHVGMTNEHVVNNPSSPEAHKARLAYILDMDLMLGVPSILLDKDKDRKKLYGKAGAHRPTKYGVEYRVLSNFWIFEYKMIEFIFAQLNKCGTGVYKSFIKDNGGEIQQIINSGNEDHAKAFIDRYHRFYTSAYDLELL